MNSAKRFRIRTYIHKPRQIFYSIPAYVKELASVRGSHELYDWAYYKCPNLFPLQTLPPYVTVELTNRCNLGCKHCWRSTMTRPIGSMELPLFEKIVGEAGRFTPRLLKIGGSGEPALHPQFSDLMRCLSPHGLKVMVYTNGALLRLFEHEEILNWGLDTIVVSIDGLTADGYEQIKLGNRYAEVRQAISDFVTYRRSVRSKHPMIEIRHIIMPQEAGPRLLDFQRDWLKLADTVKFNNLEPSSGLASIEDLSPPKCRPIRRELAIQWDGRVPLCGGYRKEYIGNVRESTIAELWKHPKLEHLRECNSKRQFADAPLCRRCCRCR